MLLSDVFSVSRIKTELEAEDKDELFEELVDVLVRSDGALNRDKVLAAITEREAKMSTGIKAGIAIPHGRAEGVPGICGVLGVSRDGIDYEALDGKPVYLVFLLVCSPDNTELYLRSLSQIAGLLGSSGFYDEVRSADNAEKALQVLKRYEEIMDNSET